MSKNVAVFVDVANIFYAAKAAGVDIDYVLLLKAASAGRDLVRAYAYTGLDPENENQRNFHSFLARNNYKVVSKDIRKYGDGRVKANLDIELVVDLMKTSRNLDVAVVVSGDGDFAPAIRAVQETGVRVEVISFRGNTSSDLIEVADRFTDITQLARVERDSTASGRRVASDEEDLSMTEVPDKESEGAGRSRGRGRGRARPERAVAEAPAARGRGRARPRAAEPEPEAGAVPAGGPAGLVALPGEKLSKAAAARLEAADVKADVAVEEDEEAAAITPVEGETEAEGEERSHRRRRRGGRGRGRGRGQEAVAGLDGAPSVDGEVEVEGAGEDEVAGEDEELVEPARPAVRPAAFGSVWDSQIGVPSAPRSGSPLEDEEYDDEPAIPEYLLAERQRGARGVQGGVQRGNRGRGGAYAAAVDRERYGSRGTSRLSEPAARGGQRPPQRSGPRPARPAQPAHASHRAAERRSSDEPWSEVPPELEELLRTQLASKLARQAPAGEAAPAEAPVEVKAPSRTRRTRTPAAATPTEAPAGEAAPAEAPVEVKAPSRTRRTRTPAAATPTEAPAGEAAPAEAPVEVKAPSRTRRTRTPAAATPTEAPAGEAAPAEAPVEVKAPSRTRRTRTPAAATPTEAPAPAPAEAPVEAKAPTRTRRTRTAKPPAGA